MKEESGGREKDWKDTGMSELLREKMSYMEMPGEEPQMIGGRKWQISMKIILKVLQMWTWTRAPYVLILGLKTS